MNTPKHSPLPWSVNDQNKEVWIKSNGAGTVAGLEVIGPKKRGRVLADAELIVRAVNSHDALVTLLWRALRYLDHPDVQTIPFALSAKGVATQIRTALDKLEAKGRTE